MDLLYQVQQVALDGNLAPPEKTLISRYMLAMDAIKRLNEQLVESSD